MMRVVPEDLVNRAVGQKSRKLLDRIRSIEQGSDALQSARFCDSILLILSCAARFAGQPLRLRSERAGAAVPT